MTDNEWDDLLQEVLAVRAALSRTEVNRMMHEFGHGGLFVLEFLEKRGGQARPKDLSASLQVSSARIAVLLAKMVQKGWVKRSPDENDSRCTIVTLTDEGARQVQQARQEIINALKITLKNLGEEDAKDLLRLEKKILQTESQKKKEDVLCQTKNAR